MGEARADAIRATARRDRPGRLTRLAAAAQARTAIRRYFEAEDFLEVETPTFSPCPGLDAHVHSLGAVVDTEGAQLGWLMTSPELHMKQLLSEGCERVFQIARCFRGEELGPWHEPEFSLVEWYRAHADFRAVMADTENLVRAVATAIGDGSLHVPAELGREERTIRLDSNFAQLTVREAFRQHADVDDAVTLAESSPEAYFQLWVDRVEPALAARGEPVFLTHFPHTEASLARLSQNDSTVAERFELLAGGVELCNGFSELTDPAEQRRRFESELRRRRDAGEPTYPMPEAFLKALADMPPAAGNALGFDRLLALSLGVHVADTLSFSHQQR